MNAPIDSNSDSKISDYLHETEVCIKAYTLGVQHKFEIDRFTQTISKDLVGKGFKRLTILDVNQKKQCDFILEYRKYAYPENLYLELILIGYPITSYREIELYAFQYDKDYKLIRQESMKNGYRHYVSWLLLPTFFLFYRPFSDEKIIEDFHNKLFKEIL
ncbi:hypothetical protein [Leptospira stimsonii]|uniref:DUF1564 domain-containing protein n=1 Tax=Leptospira stimsonii TaxID=2202203 RepID=A0ABY2N3L2_9LEPT|nr:hypothetical protein [Leptospira stimsonii]TGK26935.1 hypothetical protein EHO98_00050 [Leptospira stimsonii]TGM14888.1 hypothetical protein EHQ90_10420 [Leptospira stimsonii]